MSMVVPVAGYYGINANDMISWSTLYDTAANAVQNPYVLGCSLLAAWNAIYDPTSKGLSDCKSVMKQSDPRQ